jgi:CII-binding regulator of phage lambda lysogenization HflD
MSLKEQIVSTTKDHLGSLESKLNGLLQPVSPRPEFVNTLRQRIQITGQPAWISRFNNIQFIVILVTGVLSGVVLVTMLARFLVNLLTSKKKPSGIS